MDSPATETLIAPQAASHTIADLLHRLGDIPPERVWCTPPPGTAFERDLFQEKGLELVDDTIVEIAGGLRESILNCLLMHKLGNWDDERRQGWFALFAPVRCGAAIRRPGICYLSKSGVPDGKMPKGEVLEVPPHLIAEIVKPTNTPAEMARKRHEYFSAGVELVWIVHPNDRTVDVYTSEESFHTLTETDTLNGGDVLPGFELSIAQWFSEVE